MKPQITRSAQRKKVLPWILVVVAVIVCAVTFTGGKTEPVSESEPTVTATADPLAGVSPVPSGTTEPVSEEEAAPEFYRGVLKALVTDGYYSNPDRSVVFNLRHLLWDSEARKYVDGWDNYADNLFSVCDVDRDDNEELLLWLKANASGLKTDCVYVLGCDPVQRSLLLEGQFTPGVVFYDSGYVTSPLYGGGADDYQLYRYDPQRDFYIPLESNQAFEPGETVPFTWLDLTLEQIGTLSPSSLP